MSKILKQKSLNRYKRKLRVRSKVFGTEFTPRVSVFKSNRYFYAQAINDETGCTITCVDGSKEKARATKEGVKPLAKIFAENLKKQGVTKIVYDRNGYLYHGVVASFADALRENGIEF
jgi:large subunit ribosomal protein L18